MKSIVSLMVLVASSSLFAKEVTCTFNRSINHPKGGVAFLQIKANIASNTLLKNVLLEDLTHDKAISKIARLRANKDFNPRSERWQDHNNFEVRPKSEGWEDAIFNIYMHEELRSQDTFTGHFYYRNTGGEVFFDGDTTCSVD